ncbi:MAG: hypothetical protein U9N63_03225 [Pseudomonadota bacterium]|nr:hypothetical protein [Pseudomonadota bacterium]
MLLSTPRYRPVVLLYFLVISILLHVALIVVLPDLTRLFNIHINRLGLLEETEIEVLLVDPEVRPEPKPKPKPPPAEKPLSLLADEHVSALIDHRLEELFALGDAPLSPPAPIKLPELSPPGKSTLKALPLPETVLLVRSQELLGRLGNKPAGRLRGRRLGGTLVKPASASGSLVEGLLSSSGRKSLLKIETPVKKPIASDFGLSGPVARSRQVLFRPALPKVSLAKDVTVGFRFWVRPDGSVSRVETLKIGDLELVNVAERYLQQWRFSILASELPQQEQWGTVNILFRVSR